MDGAEGRVLAFFSKLFEFEGVIEKSEAKAVVRALRTIYFYPDRSLRALDKLIKSGGTDADALATLHQIFGHTENEVSESIKFLTSDSVRTNLKMPIEVVRDIREAVSRKSGIRANFTAMFFSIVLTRDSEAIVEAAVDAKREIIQLNEMLEAIERKMGSKNG